jgi:DNA-directed RNA polymerase specialized sigma24 family protein
MYGTLNLWPLQLTQLWRLRHPSLWAGPNFDPNDEVDLFRYATLRLPQRERDVFVLSRFKGLAYSDIARLLNIEPAAAQAHLVD